MAKRTTPSVSVVIPVYNEGRAVAPVCEAVRKALADLGDDALEVIVVDDGSTDGALAERPKDADVLLRHDTNRGYGAALKTGFAKARGKTIVIIDADGTYDPIAIPTLLKKLKPGTDMAVGARTGDVVKIPFERKPASPAPAESSV